MVPGPTPNRVLRIELTATVDNIPTDGRELRLWMPMLNSDAHQKISDRQITTALRPLMRRESVHGNTMLFFSGDEPLPNTLTVAVSCLLEMHRCNTPGPGDARGLNPGETDTLKLYLSVSGKEEELKRKLADLEEQLDYGDADATAVAATERTQLTGALARIASDRTRLGKIAAQFADPETDSYRQARAAYNHMLEKLNIAPESPEVDGTRSLVDAYESGQVSPGEYTRIMVLVLRALGIPARVEYGFLLPECPGDKSIELSESHEWVSVFIGGLGWVPVDPVAAENNPDMTDYYFGTDCAGRVRLGWGTNVNLEPQQLGDPLPIFFEPRAEVDDEVLPVTFTVLMTDLLGADGEGKTK